MEKLCRTYWYPLYAHIRRRGYSEEEAQDLTQELFQRLLERQYTYIKGIDELFAGAPEDETTAWFTFHRETTNPRVTVNGPLRIISREGTTTVYLNAAPAGDFSDPDSFRAGAPIQISTLRQQVIMDTVSQTFTVVNQDTITSSSLFSVNDNTYQIQ